MPSRILRLWNPNLAAWEEVGDSRLTAHLAASDPHAQYVLESLVDAKGDVLAASANDAPARLPVGTDAQVLTADSTQPLGLRWATPATGGMSDPTTTKGDLIARGASAPATRLPVGTDGQVLTADSAQTLGVRWATGGGMTNPMSTKGDLITTAGVTYTRYAPVGGSVSGANLGTAADTYDNNPGTQWYSNQPATTAGNWVRHDLGAAVQPVAVRLQQSTGSNGSGQWRLEYSLDGATGWTTAYTSPSGQDTVADSGIVAFTAPVAARYWRFYTVGGGGGGAWIVGEAYLYSGTALAAARLPLGTDGQVLTADGTQTLGVRWAAGPSGTYLPLAGGTLTGDLVLSEATPTVSLKLAVDTQPRSQLTDTRLTFGPGGTTAPDATLQRTGAGALRVDTNLGVGVTPAAWGTGHRAVQVGGAGAVWADAAGAASPVTFLSQNTYYDGTAFKAIENKPAVLLQLSGNGTLTYGAAPAVAVGASQTFANRAVIGATGTLTLTPDAGAQTLVGGNASDHFRISAAANAILFTSPASIVGPANDGSTNLGSPGGRWGTVYAAVGTISTSAVDQKTSITPLDPAQAMDAVRATTPCTFDYLAPTRDADWYELPLDPEDAERVLYDRLVNGPLEQAARHQAGVVLNSPDHPCDPLFQTGEGQTNAANSVGILLAALKQLDQRVSALGG